MVSRTAVEERSACRLVGLEKIGEIGRSKTVESFLSEKKDLKLNTVVYGKPIEVLENRCNVLM